MSLIVPLETNKSLSLQFVGLQKFKSLLQSTRQVFTQVSVNDNSNRNGSEFMVFVLTLLFNGFLLSSLLRWRQLFLISQVKIIVCTLRFRFHHGNGTKIETKWRQTIEMKLFLLKSENTFYRNFLLYWILVCLIKECCSFEWLTRMRTRVTCHSEIHTTRS